MTTKSPIPVTTRRCRCRTQRFRPTRMCLRPMMMRMTTKSPIPVMPKVGESPQQHKKKNMEASAKGDSHKHRRRNTEIDRQFKEKASYFFLGKEAFLKLADSKASALDAKIKQLTLAQVRVSLQGRGLEKELIKHGESFKELMKLNLVGIVSFGSKMDMSNLLM
uniref:Uncharacterized protein n=1 Tax=Oryza meridionalis TaxID=40149 RepID=A0A0E0C518_9ORYZ